MSETFTFEARLEHTGKTAAGFVVPGTVVGHLGDGGHPKVVVTIGSGVVILDRRVRVND